MGRLALLTKTGPGAASNNRAELPIAQRGVIERSLGSGPFNQQCNERGRGVVGRRDRTVSRPHRREGVPQGIALSRCVPLAAAGSEGAT